jgi:hypothetical protein
VRLALAVINQPSEARVGAIYYALDRTLDQVFIRRRATLSCTGEDRI